jgi:hypothetical protein
MGEPLDGRRVSAQWKFLLHLKAVSATLLGVCDEGAHSRPVLETATGFPVQIQRMIQNAPEPRIIPINTPARTSLKKCMPRTIREIAIIKAHAKSAAVKDG